MREGLTFCKDQPPPSEDDRRWATECALQLEDRLNELYFHSKTYTDKARSLIFNLSDTKNPELRFKILNQELRPLEVISTDVKRLASDMIKEKRETSLNNSLSMRRSDWDLQKTNDKGDF